MAVALAAAWPAQALTDAQFTPAYALFERATGGDARSTEHAAQAFGQLLKAEPTHPVLLAYSGASTAMLATTTWLPWKKMAHAEDGLAQLDKALALLTPAHQAPLLRGTPAELEVKLVAANTFLAVPGFMNRRDRGERLLKDVQSSPLLGGAPADFRTAVDKAVAKAGLAGGAK